MGKTRPAIETRLKEVLGEFQAEFQSLRDHADAWPESQREQLQLVAEKIDFARLCVDTAYRIVRDRRVKALLSPEQSN